MPDSTNLTEQIRAAIRLLAMGMRACDAAEAAGVERARFYKTLRTPESQEYLAHLRDLCDHYACAMAVLGLIPNDVLRPKRGRPIAPPSPHGLRRVVGNRLRARAGLPPDPAQDDNDAPRPSNDPTTDPPAPADDDPRTGKDGGRGDLET